MKTKKQSVKKQPVKQTSPKPIPTTPTDLAYARATSPPTRALSICQPYAFLAARGYRAIEVRTWSTNYRGPIAIHASSQKRRFTRESEIFLTDTGHPLLLADLDGPHAESVFPFGAIVGQVEVAGMRTAGELRKEIGDNLQGLIDIAFGCITGNPREIPPAVWLDQFDRDDETNEVVEPIADTTICWLFTNPVWYHSPIPTKGRLNLYELDQATAKRCAIELARVQGGEARPIPKPE